MNRQCLCGRSNTYPYCDGTHKIKNFDESKQTYEEES